MFMNIGIVCLKRTIFANLQTPINIQCAYTYICIARHNGIDIITDRNGTIFILHRPQRNIVGCIFVRNQMQSVI